MKIKRFLTTTKGKMVLGLVGLYILSVGLSFAAFSYLKSSPGGILSPGNVGDARSKVSKDSPKTEECPINGQKFSKEEKAIWEARRPLGVMIENHEESRPQSGLSNADVVYEALAEGGVTRFLGVFYCGAAASEVQVGPVRSARVYYMDWLSEYAEFPLYAHVGGANKAGPANAVGANGNVDKFGWRLYNDLDQFAVGFPTYWRDYERLPDVATEHTMYSTTDKLWEVGKERELTDKDKDGVKWDADFVMWKFQDGTPVKGQVNKVSYDFWSGFGVYSAAWNYDSATNTYKRENGGTSHLDLNNNQALSSANVVILYTKAKGPIDELKHMLYDTVGKGNALVFQNGEVVKASWSKASRTARTKFVDAGGADVKFVRGQIWITVLDPSSEVVY
ncbi:MAG: DUF3048 domain-containing protein [bacterium]|nr:DUF3048 domain-containing protein [bacterium]